jgi:hypothetical protein
VLQSLHCPSRGPSPAPAQSRLATQRSHLVATRATSATVVRGAADELAHAALLVSRIVRDHGGRDRSWIVKVRSEDRDVTQASKSLSFVTASDRLACMATSSKPQSSRSRAAVKHPSSDAASGPRVRKRACIRHEREQHVHQRQVVREIRAKRQDHSSRLRAMRRRTMVSPSSLRHPGPTELDMPRTKRELHAEAHPLGMRGRSWVSRADLTAYVTAAQTSPDAGSSSDGISLPTRRGVR